MAESTQIRRLDQRPLKEAISTRGRSLIPWLTKDDLIKYFFGANASVAIVVLGLIMLSLFSESIGFNPVGGFFGQNYRSLLVYREAGLEFVDIIKKESADLDQIGQMLADARLQALKRLIAQGKSQGKTEDQGFADATAALASFDDYATRFGALDGGLNDIASNLGDTVVDTKAQIKIVEDKKAEKQLYLSVGKKDLADKVTYEDVDLDAAVKPLRDALPSIQDANTKLSASLNDFINQPPPTVDAAMQGQLASFAAHLRAYQAAIPDYQKQLETWNPHAPLAWLCGHRRFLLQHQLADREFVAGLLRHHSAAGRLDPDLDCRLVIAIPLGVGAGVYINQIATPWEQNIIKPAIEFISAIPSVVLGFFGVAVLGEFLRQLSRWGYLPPFSERLNIITAGILLAFMAIPTIFTLTEDAINNVPRAFKEASYALGANGSRPSGASSSRRRFRASSRRCCSVSAASSAKRWSCCSAPATASPFRRSATA